MTIYEIKRLTENTAPFFFSRKTLKFFGQTMKSFSVYKVEKRFLICAARIHGGKVCGYTERFFNPENKTLERS